MNGNARVLDPAALGDHVDRLYRAAWAMCGSREDAEDLVQDTFARVLAKPRLLRNDDDLGYLLRVLRNTFVTRHRASTPAPGDDRDARDVRAGRPRDRLAARGGVRARARCSRHIAALPEAFRDALVAVDVVGPLLRRGGPRARDPRGDDHQPPLPRAGAGRRAGWNRTGKASCRSRHGRHRSPDPGRRPAPRGGARRARARARRRSPSWRRRRRSRCASGSSTTASTRVRAHRRRWLGLAGSFAAVAAAAVAALVDLARRRLGPERPRHRRARRAGADAARPEARRDQRRAAADEDRGAAVPRLGPVRVARRRCSQRRDRGPACHDGLLRQPEGRAGGLHDPRRLGHQGPRGREEGRRAGHAVLRHVPRGAAGRRVGPRRPHVRHERAGGRSRRRTC